MGRYVHITLSEYFNLKGYGKGKRVNLTVFSEMTGVSISFISKLLRNCPISSRGKNFRDIDKILNADGYKLVCGDAIGERDTILQRKVNSLEKENAELKKKILFLEQQILDYKEIKALCKKIASKS